MTARRPASVPPGANTGPLTRSQIMSRVRDRDTTPERVLRSALHARGLRFRTCKADLPGKPDIVLAAPRVCVFVDGDYWHGGQWLRRGLTCLDEQFENTADRSYWIGKIERNMDRDCRATADLLAAGWTVLRFWESEVTARVEECADRVLAAVSDGEGAASPEAGARMRARMAERSTAEFFCGIGLMRYALERQGWGIRFANDIDAKKRDMYATHFDDADAHYHLGDIHALAAADVPPVSLATAAFPCNDLSLAGARRGLEGAHSSAFWGFARLLRDLGDRRPPLVMIENVSGLMTSHNGRDLRAVLEALNDLDYDVDALLINARRFTPQSRPRLFVIAAQRALPDAEAGAPALTLSELADCPQTAPDADVRPAALRRFIVANADLRWRLRRLPPLPDGRPRLAKIVEKLPPDDPLWWEPDRAAYLLSQMSPAHAATMREMMRRRTRAWGTIFRRVRAGQTRAELRTDGLAGCLRTPRGGSGRQILLEAGGGKARVRLMTPRECARLMGADDYQIEARPNQALFGFGDAVCVPVIEWIARRYLNPLVCEAIRGAILRPT